MKMIFLVFFLFLASQATAGSLNYYPESGCKMSEYLMDGDVIEVNERGGWNLKFSMNNRRTNEDRQNWLADARQFHACESEYQGRANNDRKNIQGLIDAVKRLDAYEEMTEVVSFDNGNLPNYIKFTCYTVDKPTLMFDDKYSRMFYNQLVDRYNQSLKDYARCHKRFASNTRDDYNLIKDVQLRSWAKYVSRLSEKR